ncbi:MAG: hypothetical protein P3C10_04250 [Gemmatimonadota bacterium]|nr:hypothetical protein [Gemmatimonadota bacterium]
MPERVRFTSWPRLRGPLALCGLVLAAVTAAACTESLDGGAACPSLCPSKVESFRDTIVDAVVLDTSLGGYPALGLSPFLLIANRPDTVVTSGVIRFDVLPAVFSPNNGATVDSITVVDSVFLRFPLDSTGRRGNVPVTLEVFDVDTTASDSVTAVVRSLFRPDRRIGSLEFTPSAIGDSIRIPFSKTVLAAKIAAKGRLRLGVRIRGGAGQLRAVSFVNGVGAPTVVFDPSTDTTYAPQQISPSTIVPNATADVELAYAVYSISDLASPPPDASTLVVGGYPAYRSYLRFNVPARISDSSTIVRAEVLLTQRPSAFGDARDSATMLALVPTTTELVSDLRRILDLAASGSFAGVDSTRMLPSASGVRTVNVLALARNWRTLPTNVPRALAFKIGFEGAQPAELRFYSSKAAASLRPRLRITYLPRSEFALP